MKESLDWVVKIERLILDVGSIIPRPGVLTEYTRANSLSTSNHLSLLLHPSETNQPPPAPATMWAACHGALYSYAVRKMNPSLSQKLERSLTDVNYVIRNCGVSWKNLEETGCYSTSISSNSSNFCIPGLCSPQIFRNVLEMIDMITVILCAKEDLSVFSVFV